MSVSFDDWFSNSLISLRILNLEGIVNEICGFYKELWQDGINVKEESVAASTRTLQARDTTGRTRSRLRARSTVHARQIFKGSVPG
jgi:hypothetical protein